MTHVSQAYETVLELKGRLCSGIMRALSIFMCPLSPLKTRLLFTWASPWWLMSVPTRWSQDSPSANLQFWAPEFRVVPDSVQIMKVPLSSQRCSQIEICHITLLHSLLSFESQDLWRCQYADIYGTGKAINDSGFPKFNTGNAALFLIRRKARYSCSSVPKVWCRPNLSSWEKRQTIILYIARLVIADLARFFFAHSV